MQDMKIVLGSILPYILEAPSIAMASIVLIITFCAELLSTESNYFLQVKRFFYFESNLNSILPHIRVDVVIYASYTTSNKSSAIKYLLYFHMKFGSTFVVFGMKKDWMWISKKLIKL